MRSWNDFCHGENPIRLVTYDLIYRTIDDTVRADSVRTIDGTVRADSVRSFDGTVWADSVRTIDGTTVGANSVRPLSAMTIII